MSSLGETVKTQRKVVSIDSIREAPYNPRRALAPGDPEYEKLKKSIEEFGLVEDLVWNEQTGTLVGGHQRLAILKQKGVKQVEVNVVHLDEKREKALNIALNKIQGGWDVAKLKEVIIDLDDGAFDVELTGFDEKEIEVMMVDASMPEETLPQGGGFKATTNFEIIVECLNEDEQRQLFDRFTGEGLKCRVLTL